MNEVLYVQSYIELLKMDTGGIFKNIYIYWYLAYSEKIMKEWFKGEYIDVDIICEMDVLKLHMVGKFYEWIESEILED